MQISQNISHLMKNSAIEVAFLVKTQNMWRNSLYLGEIKTINQAFYYLKQVITPHFTTQDAYNEQKLHPKKLQKNEKQTLHQQQGTKKKVYFLGSTEERTLYVYQVLPTEAPGANLRKKM